MHDRILTIALSVAAALALTQLNSESPKELTVDRLIVTKELIVSDTGMPWEKGFESEQIPRGIHARSLGDGPGGLWVRSRLIKGEIDVTSGVENNPAMQTMVYGRILPRACVPPNTCVA